MLYFHEYIRTRKSGAFCYARCMVQSYFFYDLETSGLNPRSDRIMQFAGIRTDMEFNQIGEPVNVLVRLNDDTLPSPEATMVTGITPQQTVEEGYSEAEFAAMLCSDIFTPDTITVGFNNIRFDDEFIRYLFWRNFYDPYEWCWKDGCSRWDMLDVVRITRALRPEGIEWPVTEDGKPTNRLELLTKVNGIDHFKAHDALSDVEALIAVTKMISEKQPQLFQYLLKMRSKNEVAKLVSLNDKKPFVYTSGRYEADYNKTTVAFPLAPGANSNIAVYDLRYDPTPFVGLSAAEVKQRLFASYEDRKKDDFVRLPIKEIQTNRSPAVAPIGVLEQADGWSKIQLSVEKIDKHRQILLSAPHFAENVRAAYRSRPAFPTDSDPEAQLYGGFLSDRDKLRVETVRNATERELADFNPDFSDERLNPLLLHYKARSFPKTLSESEIKSWENWRHARIQKQLPGFMESIGKLASSESDDNKRFILQELQLWAESIIPSDSSE